MASDPVRKPVRRNRHLAVRISALALAAALIPWLAFERRGREVVAEGLAAIDAAQAAENEIAVRSAHQAALDRLEGVVRLHGERAQPALAEFSRDRGLFEPSETAVKALALFLERHPELLAVKTFDPGGRSLATAVQPATPPALAETFRNLPPPPEEARGGPHWGVPLAGPPESHVLFAPLSVPLGRGATGWLTAALDLRHLLADLQAIRPAGSGRVWAVDESGRVVLHWDVARAFERADASRAAIVEAAAGGFRGGLMAYEMPAGDRTAAMVGLYRNLEQPAWTLITAMAESDVEFALARPRDYAATLNRALSRAVLWSGLLALAWLALLARHLQRSAARPLARLARALGECAAGDRDQYIPPPTRDEVGRAIESFNAMCGKP